jgi:hypothetical protein
LQLESDQVEEVDKLAENEALRRRVLLSQITELLNERFNLRRRFPGVDVKSAQHPLTGGHVFRQLKRGRFEVDREGQMTDRAGRLRAGGDANTIEQRCKRENRAETYVVFNSCVDVLRDALSVEYVTTFGLDSVLGYVAANSTHCRLPFVLVYEHASILLTANDKIGMASHLSHTCQPGRTKWRQGQSSPQVGRVLTG